MNLKIASDLSLPLDVVTQTLAILAKRRAGKSYTMRRLIEQLFGAGQQVVIVDPKGDQWGVRSAANGKDPGLAIVILGGERGDVALEASSGEIIAKLVVEERISVLLDLSLFRKHEVATFMTAFMENIYRLKAREIYRTPMMLVIDEADAIAPQKPQKGEERMLGAAEDIVRRGGQRGIGCVLVTQRSAVLNKNVLTQAQILVVLRTIAPQDLAAMKAWIDVHGDEQQGKTLMASLPSLPTGDAWFWSPGWPTVDGIFKRVHVLPIDTFDSGASPKPGAKLVEPKNLADIDLSALKGHMAATIEKSKADDPKLLRKKIAELEQAKAKSGSADADQAYANGYDKGSQHGHSKGKIDGYQAAMNDVIGMLAPVGALLSNMPNISDAMEKIGDWAKRKPPESAKSTQIIREKFTPAPTRAVRLPVQSAAPRINGSESPSVRKILDAIHSAYPVSMSFAAAAARAAISKRSSAYNSYQRAISQSEEVENVGGKFRSAQGFGNPVTTIGDPVETWASRLPPSYAAMLRAISRSAKGLSKNEIADLANVSPTSSGLGSGLRELTDLALVEFDGDVYRLAEGLK